MKSACEIIVRTAVPADIDRMVLLLHELFQIEIDFNADQAAQRRGLEQLLQPGDRQCVRVAVAPDTGMVIGMATMQLVISTSEGAFSGWIEDVTIHLDWRRRGVGTRLLTALMAWGRARGATRFQLLADRANSAALHFYRQLGWRETRLTCLRNPHLSSAVLQTMR